MRLLIAKGLISILKACCVLSPWAVLKPVIHLPNVGSRWRLLPADAHGCLAGKQWELLWALGGSAFLGQLSFGLRGQSHSCCCSSGVWLLDADTWNKTSDCVLSCCSGWSEGLCSQEPLPCTPRAVPGEAASSALQLSCPLLTRTRAAGIVLCEIRTGARTWNDCGIIESCTLKPPVPEANAAIKNGKQR